MLGVASMRGGWGEQHQGTCGGAGDAPASLMLPTVALSCPHPITHASRLHRAKRHLSQGTTKTHHTKTVQPHALEAKWHEKCFQVSLSNFLSAKTTQPSAVHVDVVAHGSQDQAQVQEEEGLQSPTPVARHLVNCSE